MTSAQVRCGISGLSVCSRHPSIRCSDALSAYLPFHYCAEDLWGIYLSAEGTHVLAGVLFEAAHGDLAQHDAVAGRKGVVSHAGSGR